MTDRIFVQLTPIPYGLRPTSPLEQLALASDGKTDALTAFLENEKADFERWALGVEPSRTTFSIVNGSPTKFGLFAGPVPDPSDTGHVAKGFRRLVDAIFTGALYGDKGAEVDGESFASRARWLVDRRSVKAKDDKLRAEMADAFETLANAFGRAADEEDRRRNLLAARKRRAAKKMLIILLIASAIAAVAASVSLLA